jgi:glycosyltransferase involved in cell wall biosynthesis
MSDLITAIIPTYNRSRFLPRALRSVAEQTYRPIECIVIDDGSTDGTAELIPAQKQMLAAAGVELTYVEQPNAGPARARNSGLARANGAYVACLDSDDFWKPDFLSTTHRLLQSYPSAGLAFGGYLCVDVDEKLLGERPTGLPASPGEGLLKEPFPRIMDYMPTGTPCILMRRSALDAVGGFDTDFHIGEDWDLWYRIAKQFDFAYCLTGLTCCRDHPNNMPKYNAGAIADKVKLILKHLPDVRDPAAKHEQVRRLRAEMVLLQEQLLRECKEANGYTTLLRHELAPQSMRYRLGAVMRRQPKWVGRAYANLVRKMGTWHRGQATLGKREEK